jgi:hypothetical protein
MGAACSVAPGPPVTVLPSRPAQNGDGHADVGATGGESASSPPTLLPSPSVAARDAAADLQSLLANASPPGEKARPQRGRRSLGLMGERVPFQERRAMLLRRSREIAEHLSGGFGSSAKKERPLSLVKTLNGALDP